MANKRISFLVPTLGNRPKELKRLFDSLISQTVKNFEVIVVVQDNFDSVKAFCESNMDRLEITYVSSLEKGLSKARNVGMSYCKGEVIVLSDDDCWYPENAVEIINDAFSNENVDVTLTKIYDFNNNQEYKHYENKEKSINSVFTLLSKSSIEIAFKSKYKNILFDENLGLGATFVCCEEVDFLIRLYREGARIKFFPITTVYHDKKYSGSTRKQVVAKGAVYSKNFNFIIGLMICVKDILLR
ncbi:MAG: glycosyltransferase family 2 protein, partial [Roseburia sp.]